MDSRIDNDPLGILSPQTKPSPPIQKIGDNDPLGILKKKVGGNDAINSKLNSDSQSKSQGGKPFGVFSDNQEDNKYNSFPANEKPITKTQKQPPVKPSIDNNFGMKSHNELAINNQPSSDVVSNPTTKSMQQRTDDNIAKIQQNNVSTAKAKPITKNVLNPTISTELSPKDGVEKPDFNAASFLKDDISLPHINPKTNTMLDYSKVDPNDIVSDKNSLAYYGKLRTDAIDNQISFLESDKEGAGKNFNKEQINELKTYKAKLQQSVDYFAQIHGGLEGKDATDAGVVRAKINGDPTAYQYDRLKKEHGTLNDATSFNFENQGLQSQQTALDAQYSGKEKDENYDKQSADILKQRETIWDRHPKELVRQWGGVIANYASDKLPAWKKLSGLWIKDVPEYISEMRKEGYDIPQSVSQNITDEDVPMNMSIPAQTWYGAASHLEGMIGGVKRLGGEALGMDEDAVTQSIQNSRDYLDKRYATPTNEQLYQPEEKTDLKKGSPTYMMPVPNPNAGRINPTGTAITDEVFKGLGGFGAFMATLGLGGKVAEGILGKAIPEIAGTADATKLAHDYSLAANVVLGSYEGNYQQAGKIIGDNPSDEGKRGVLAMTNSLIDYLVFKAIPTQKYASALLDGKQQVSAELGKALKDLPADLKGLTTETIEKPIKERLLKPIVNALEETGKFGGAQQAGIIAHKIAQTVVSGGNEQSSKDWDNIGKESKDMWASLPISMLPGILGGEFLSSGASSNLRKQGNFYAFANREQSIADINKAKDEGLINQDQANKRIQVINTGSKIIDQIPEISPLSGRRFTHNEAVEWVNSRIKEVALEAQKNKVTDDNVLSENFDKRIKALQQVRQSILEGSYNTEPTVETETTQTEPKDTKVEPVSGEDLKGKKIYSDFNSTIADKDNKLLPFGEEIKQRINNGEPITIVTKSEDKEGQPEGSNKKRMLDALGLKEQPENLKIIEGVTPEEKSKLAKDGVLIDNSSSVKDASDKSGTEFINANKYNTGITSDVEPIPNKVQEKDLSLQSKNNNNAELISNRLSPEEKQGGIEAGQTFVQAANDVDRVHQSGQGTDTGIENVREAEEAELEKKAKENGTWIENPTETYGEKPHTYGAEQNVYLNKDGTTVTKINSGSMHETWQDFLDRIAIHNSLFPDTKYTLKGFTNHEGDFSAVIEQPLVKGTPASFDEVKEDLAKRGFEQIPDEENGGGATQFDFRNKRTGVLLFDVHGKNVIKDEAGNLRYIDPIIFRDTEEKGFGGTRQEQQPTESDENLKKEKLKADYAKRVERRLNDAAEEADPIKKALLLHDALTKANKVGLDNAKEIETQLNNHLAEHGLKIELPEIGSKYNETNTGVDASIAGSSADDLVVTEVVQPGIRKINEDGKSSVIVKKPKVIVMNKAEFEKIKANEQPTISKEQPTIKEEPPIVKDNSIVEDKTTGKSNKIVDELGNPLIVYHGTTADLSEGFKPTSFGSFGEHGFFYFAKDKNWVKKFGKEDNIQGRDKLKLEVTI